MNEQQQWLDLTRQHLVTNVIIEEAGLELLPILASIGGLGKSRKIFGTD